MLINNYSVADTFLQIKRRYLQHSVYNKNLFIQDMIVSLYMDREVFLRFKTPVRAGNSSFSVWK